MAQNIQMDPIAKDYIFQNGSPVPSNRIYEAAYFALAIPQLAWLYGQTDQGSLLYKLQNKIRNGSVEQNFASYVNAAIQAQLIATGQASAVTTTNLQATRTGTSNQIAVTPTAQPVQSQFTFTSV